MNAFRIIGDEIEYEYQLFARIAMPEHSTLRACAVDEIRSLDPEAKEKEDAEWCKDLEDEAERNRELLEGKIGDLENQVSELESENDELRSELQCLEDKGGLPERIGELKADAARWRLLAETYGSKLRELQAPKPRKRRTR